MNNNYGRLAIDKTQELEKRLKKNENKEVIPDYSEKVVTKTCISSIVDNRIAEKLRWKLFSTIGGQITIDIKVVQGDNINIYLLYNKEVIFDTLIKGDRAIFQRGGGIPEGINEIDFALLSTKTFTVEITITYRGKFSLLESDDRVFLVNGGGYAFLKDGKFDVYDNLTEGEVFSIYGVETASVAKRADGNYCLAVEDIFGVAQVKILSEKGEVINSYKLNGRFSAFAVVTANNIATIYAVESSRLTMYTLNGDSLTEEKTSIKATKISYAENEDIKLLEVRNPIGYEYVYKV